MNLIIFFILSGISLLLVFLCPYFNNKYESEFTENKPTTKIELAIVFVIMILINIIFFFKVGNHIKEYLMTVFFSIYLIFISYIDYKKKAILDILTFPLLIMVIIYTIFSGVFLKSVMGAGLALIPVFIIYSYGHLFTKQEENIGLGDLKLIFIVALFLPNMTFIKIFLFYFCMFTVGSFVGIFILVRNRRIKDIDKKVKEISFAPFITIGFILFVLFYPVLIKYLI